MRLLKATPRRVAVSCRARVECDGFVSVARASYENDHEQGEIRYLHSLKDGLQIAKEALS